MTDLKVEKTLVKLYQIAEAGERGYATAATNTPNAGLKILFKIYAQQRAHFKDEISAELRRLGRNVRPSASIPAMIHRGRVTIFAAMTIEKETQEKVILKEAALGERFALRAYQKGVKAGLPAPLQALVARHLAEIQRAADQLNLLLGQEERRLVVYIENSEDPSSERPLKDIDLLAEVSQKIAVSPADLYQGKGATVFETALSGAFGGGLWGGLIGLLVGFGVVQTVSPAPAGAEMAVMWLLSALAFSFLGALVAAGMAFFIGASIAEDDAYQVGEIAKAHPVLVQTLVGAKPAQEKA
jgi:uncharacterized protein (TIGR02284 family)